MKKRRNERMKKRRKGRMKRRSKIEREDEEKKWMLKERKEMGTFLTFSFLVSCSWLAIRSCMMVSLFWISSWSNFIRSLPLPEQNVAVSSGLPASVVSWSLQEFECIVLFPQGVSSRTVSVAIGRLRTLSAYDWQAFLFSWAFEAHWFDVVGSCDWLV